MFMCAVSRVCPCVPVCASASRVKLNWSCRLTVSCRPCAPLLFTLCVYSWWIPPSPPSQAPEAELDRLLPMWQELSLRSGTASSLSLYMEDCGGLPMSALHMRDSLGSVPDTVSLLSGILVHNAAVPTHASDLVGCVICISPPFTLSPLDTACDVFRPVQCVDVALLSRFQDAHVAPLHPFAALLTSHHDGRPACHPNMALANLRRSSRLSAMLLRQVRLASCRHAVACALYMSSSCVWVWLGHVCPGVCGRSEVLTTPQQQPKT